VNPPRRRSRLTAVIALALAAARAPAQGAVESLPPGRPFTLLERSDFSRYVDGKYVGHAYREARGALEPSGDGYAGEFLVLEETLRDMRSSARRVDRTAPVRLVVGLDSSLELREDSGYPSLRGLPSFPKGPGAPSPQSFEPGSTWIAPGSRALDFEDSGAFVVLPFLAQYTYKGLVDYRGAKAMSLSAKFATRWKAGASSGGEAGAGARPVSDVVASASGTHDLDIFVDASSLSALFIRDRFDESFVLVAGGSERRSGFSLLFFEGSPPGDRRAMGAAIAAAIDAADAGGAGGPKDAASTGSEGVAAPKGAAEAGAAAETPVPGAGLSPLIAGEGPGIDETLAPGIVATAPMRAAGLELDTSPEGLVLRVKDLRFIADSDDILPAELWRLDEIASALKALPNKSFLVAGYSAGVGRAAGEFELSVKRAKRVADELSARGMAPSRLLYRGYGSAKPLAPNDSEEGRARNRRVEITILD
jgi:outer membrane protein OmpA-like peptidoglycan-associated protein